MEVKPTQTANRQTESFANFFDNEINVNVRLEELLKINAQNEQLKASSYNSLQELEAELIKNPISTQKAIQWFGAMLGTFPPMAIFGMFIANAKINQSKDFWIIPLLIFVNLISATTGYFSGKFIAKMVAETEKWNWATMLITLPFIGIFWGILTGGASGIFIFGIGAIFGAIIAAMVGGSALPIFTIFHRWLKKGDLIERNQFLPIAFGITATICAFILGLNIK